MSIRALILLVLVLSSLANAQSANWLEVPQPAIGKRVIVALKTGSTQRGILEIVEPDSLTIKGHAAIARADVRTVRVRQGMTRGKRAARGALIGAIAGGVVYGGTAVLVVASGQERTGGLLAGVVLGGIVGSTALGALIGAAMPHSYQTIYQAP